MKDCERQHRAAECRLNDNFPETKGWRQKKREDGVSLSPSRLFMRKRRSAYVCVCAAAAHAADPPASCRVCKTRESGLCLSLFACMCFPSTSASRLRISFSLRHRV